MNQDTQDLGSLGITPEMIETAMDTDFAKQLEESLGSDDAPARGNIVKGIVTGIENDMAIVDIGMKAEGRVALAEFADLETNEVTLKEGDEVEVYLDSLDDRNGEPQMSREKARREEVLIQLEKAAADSEKVQGTIFSRVKGGFAVDVQGILAFLPGSQLDPRPIKDAEPFMHTPLDFMILKLDRQRGNVIVSRRSVLDEHRAADREELLKDMHEGKVLEGVVKNITDYGAFIDLGGVDGLLHITDIAWHRINHPSEVIALGQTIEVKVIRFDEENKRVSLGYKQLHEDPWANVEENYPLGAKVKGTVTNITDYGAFVELAPGIEGLIHVSEMSWTRKNVHPGKLVSTSEEVEVMVLEIDRDKRRISLGLKQCQDNPWQAYAKEHSEGDLVEGTIRSITDFGIFLGLTEDIDGLIHVSDLSWDKSGEDAIGEYKKGDTIKARILTLDPEKERIALGIKQLSDDPMSVFTKNHKKGDIIKVTVTYIDDDGITVKVDEGFELPIKRKDLAAQREMQDPHRFKEGEEVEAKIVNFGSRDRKVALSIRAIEVAEEKEAIKAYATDGGDSGSTLGDALGDALGSLKTEEEPAKEAKKATKPKAETKAKKEAASEETESEDKS